MLVAFVIFGCAQNFRNNFDNSAYSIEKITKNWHNTPNNPYEKQCVTDSLGTTMVDSNNKVLPNYYSNNIEPAAGNIAPPPTISTNKTKQTATLQHNVDSLSKDWRKSVRKRISSPAGRYCIYIPEEEEENDTEDYHYNQKIPRKDNKIIITPKLYPLFLEVGG